MDPDAKAPTTPSRLLMLPLSSSPLDASTDPTKSEIHDCALDEGHHTANSSPFDSDPEDDTSKTGLESPCSRKLTSLLSPVMEQPEELFSENAKSTSAVDDVTDSAHTVDEKASMESDLIQLENEIAANTDQEDEHEMASENASPENSSLLDDNSVITTIGHDQLQPLVPSPKQEEPDLIDFTTPGVTVTEEEMEAGSELEEGAQNASMEPKLLESNDEEDTGIAEDKEESEAAQELIDQPTHEAYGDTSELAVIMEEEEEVLRPAHPSYANLAALQLEKIRTEQLRQYQERQYSEVAPLAKSNSHESHKEEEQVDSAVGDDRSHVSFEEDADTSKALDAIASHQFLLLSVKDKQYLLGGNQSLHLEEGEYSEHEDLKTCLAAIAAPTKEGEGTTNANIDSSGKSQDSEEDALRNRSDSLQSGELPTQEHLKKYLATMKIPVEIGAEATCHDDFVYKSITDYEHHDMNNDSTNNEETTNTDTRERQLSVILPPTELRFTAESAMTPRDKSWYIRSPTEEEQRQGLNLPTMPVPTHDDQQRASAQDVEEVKTTTQDYQPEAAMSTNMALPTLDLPPVTPAQKGSQSIFRKYGFGGIDEQRIEEERIAEQLQRLKWKAERKYFAGKGGSSDHGHHDVQQESIDTAKIQTESTREVKAFKATPVSCWMVGNHPHSCLDAVSRYPQTINLSEPNEEFQKLSQEPSR